MNPTHLLISKRKEKKMAPGRRVKTTKAAVKESLSVSVEEAIQAKPNKKETDKQQGKKKKRFSTKRYTVINGSYKRYVFKVLKQVHPELGLSTKTMTIMDDLMNDLFERIAGEAAKLTKYTGKETISSWEIEAAVKLLLPGELAKYAASEGFKAVSNYVKAVKAE